MHRPRRIQSNPRIKIIMLRLSNRRHRPSPRRVTLPPSSSSGHHPRSQATETQLRYTSRMFPQTRFRERKPSNPPDRMQRHQQTLSPSQTTNPIFLSKRAKEGLTALNINYKSMPQRMLNMTRSQRADRRRQRQGCMQMELQQQTCLQRLSLWTLQASSHRIPQKTYRRRRRWRHHRRPSRGRTQTNSQISAQGLKPRRNCNSRSSSRTSIEPCTRTKASASALESKKPSTNSAKPLPRTPLAPPRLPLRPRRVL